MTKGGPKGKSEGKKMRSSKGSTKDGEGSEMKRHEGAAKNKGPNRLERVSWRRVLKRVRGQMQPKVLSKMKRTELLR